MKITMLENDNLTIELIDVYGEVKDIVFISATENKVIVA